MDWLQSAEARSTRRPHNRCTDYVSFPHRENFEQRDSPSTPRRPLPDMLRDSIGRFLRDRSDTARSGKIEASNLPGKRESSEGTELYSSAPWRRPPGGSLKRRTTP